MLERITDFNFGSVTIDGNVYNSDVIVLPDRVIPSWWRRSGHKLLPEDLGDVVEAAPEVLVVGTGSFGIMRVPDSTVKFLREHGIETIVCRTKEACERFNTIATSRQAAVALHLTC